MSNDLLMLAQGLRVEKAVVESLDRGGVATLCLSDSGTLIGAQSLQTGPELPPPLILGDSVLVAVSPESEFGYILGVVRDCREAKPSVKSGQTEVTIPGDVEKLRISASTIRIEAEQRLEIVCGDSVITIDDTGKIVTRAESITSRAKGKHKIRGGSVAIN